jgi:hypothetical protein
VAVIGEGVRVQGFALAGALVFAAEDPGGAHAAWRSLPPDVEVVVLTPGAAAWLRDALGSDGTARGHADTLPRRPGVLTVVMPGAVPGLPGAVPGLPGAVPGAPDVMRGASP